MKVGFITRDDEHVQGQLRSAPRLLVYQVTAAGSRLERSCAFDPAADRSTHRLEALAGAALVYVAAIGPSMAARLAARGVQAATAREGTPIRDVLRSLERRLRGPGAAALLPAGGPA